MKYGTPQLYPQFAGQTTDSLIGHRDKLGHMTGHRDKLGHMDSKKMKYGTC